MASWKDKLALTAQRNRQEIVKAKLDRREMMRLGLLTAGGALIAKAGLSSRAFGQAAPTLTDPDATLRRVPASPPVVRGCSRCRACRAGPHEPGIHGVWLPRWHHADRRR